MQTRYPDINQINTIRQRTQEFMYHNGRNLNPAIVDFINVLHAVPGFAVEYLPAPESVLRVYTTEDCQGHMSNIHMDIVNRLMSQLGNYDWYRPGACNFTMNSFLLPTQNGGVWLPVWEARVASLEQGQMSLTFTRAFGDAIFNYLRTNRFIQ